MGLKSPFVSKFKKGQKKKKKMMIKKWAVLILVMSSLIPRANLIPEQVSVRRDKANISHESLVAWPLASSFPPAS
jgi:hypothetical protein